MFKIILLLLAATLTLNLTIGSLPCCPATYVFDRDTLTCVCPPTAAFVTADGSCVSCASPSTWNNSTLTCQKCRNDQSENAQGVCVCPT